MQPHAPLLHTKLSDIQDPQLRELLQEIAQVKYLSLAKFENGTLFTFLTMTQRHSVTEKPESIQAAGCYSGSPLKRRVKDVLNQPMGELAIQLCRWFRVSDEFIGGSQYYVFLNQIMNPKSKLRKPPPFRLFGGSSI